ncbi:uncharacterized protein LOC112569299 [Pomacea canaliculata]|uniref:uncharacterized protein LOC112569299 n=1 Tax=Pomacea canaliculata TaxID=400727 RepID=UPI000D7254BC|nr:uncharacterized protein LOC112569299 [Pomacea canaliculata]
MFVVTCIYSAFLLLMPYVDAQLKSRLVNGTAPWNGRLEILYNGTWGTVCDDIFGKEEAQVTCRMLGFVRSQALVVASFMYGGGSGLIILDDLMCTGEETSLDQCDHRGFTENDCSHSEDVGIICSTQPVKLRLRNTQSSSPYKGRAEMQIGGGHWIELCTSDNNMAKVVCRQLGLSSHAAIFTNASVTEMSLYGERERLTPMSMFICLGNETSLFECQQAADSTAGYYYRFCDMDYIICDDSLYLRILFDDYSYPPLEGTNMSLECERAQSLQSNVDYWWYKDSREVYLPSFFEKSLIFNKVTSQHQGLRVQCMARYNYNGLIYREASDTLVIQVCCAPTINSTDGPPPALSSIGDEGHLSIEMTAHPTPHLINITYLGPVLNESIEGKNIGNSTLVDCVANLVSRASVTCSITIFNISQAAEGFYKAILGNSLGHLPFIFKVNRNVDRTGERSSFLLTVRGSSLGGAVTVIAAAIFFICHWKRRNKSCETRQTSSERKQSAGVRLEEIPAGGVMNVYHEEKTVDRGKKTQNADKVDSYPIYVNTAELAEEKDHIYSNVGESGSGRQRHE